jgi:hypothetical protein
MLPAGDGHAWEIFTSPTKYQLRMSERKTNSTGSRLNIHCAKKSLVPRPGTNSLSACTEQQ